MSKLLVCDTKMIDKIQTKFDNLIGTYNSNIKKLFLDFVKRGYTPESIGEYFERSLEEFERKNKGQYYTPKVIVEYIISQLDITEDSKILDPACGCGSFLLTVFDIFKKRFGTHFLKNIFGVDINDNAVNMTRLCLYMNSGFNDNYIDVIRNNIKTGNCIVSRRDIDKNAFDWYQEFSEVMTDGGFDFIIGNPPYITLTKLKDFDPSESIYSKIIDGPVNAATLMIGRSIELLKQNGVLAFLLPKSILYVDSYAKLRDYLSHKAEILQIYDLGSKFRDVRGEQFILILKKRSPDLNKKVKIRVFSDKTSPLSKQSLVEIEQGKLADINRFLTFEEIRYYDIIRKISNIGIKLNEFVNGQIFRGLPVGGNKIKNKKDNIKGEKIIRGKNITKFKIRCPFIIDKNLLKKQSKAKINALRHKKVVLQNIFSSESGVIAAYDPEGILSVDTVTNIIVSDDEKGKYLLALLSSKLINFYIMYALFNRSKLTMHLDKSYLGLLPIVADPDKEKLKRILNIIDSLSEDNDIDSQKTKNKEIDKIVYDLYSLNEREIKLIEEATAKLLSKRSLW